MRSIVHKLLITLTALAIILSLGLLLQTDSLAPAVVFIGGPFVAVILAIMWVAYATYPTLRKSFESEKGVGRKLPTHVQNLSRIGVYLLILGAVLLVYFGFIGGPNSFSSAGYLPMQIGFGSLILGALFSIAAYKLNNSNGKPRPQRKP